MVYSPRGGVSERKAVARRFIKTEPQQQEIQTNSLAIELFTK